MAIAAALKGETYTQFIQRVSDKKQAPKGPNGSCFTCSQMGHFSTTCPQKNLPPQTQSVNPPQAPCPHCQKGFHWARDCRSNFHKNGTILEAIALKAADSIIWKNDSPVWVEQWPLTTEKLKAAGDLVKQQLSAGHIEPSNSP